MFEESRTAFFRLREDDGGTGGDWPLQRLAQSAHLAGRAFGEPLLGTLVDGAPADLVVLDYAAPTPVHDGSFAGHWVFGLSSRNVRDVMVAGEWAVLDRQLARADQRQLAAEAPVEAERLWQRLDEIPAHTFEPEGGRLMAVTSEGRVALYLQDKHPIREGMEYVQLAEEKGFEAVWQAESRLVREATVPMAAFAAVTERIAVGSGVVNNWTRNVGLLAATFSTLDDLAPGRVKLGIGAWWDPLAAKVGIHRAQEPDRDARDGRGGAAAARDGARHLRRRVRAPGRRRDRHRPRRPLAEERARSTSARPR